MSDKVAGRLMELLDETRLYGAHVVVLDGEIGRGKSYAVQRFYDMLVGRADSDPWLDGLSPTRLPASTQLLQRQRKAVRGVRTGRISKRTPWLWIGALCDSLDTGFDNAAASLAQQIDAFVEDRGFAAIPAAARVLAEGALDIASDALQLSTIKTIVQTVRGLARVASAEYESRPVAHERSLRSARAKLVNDALLRLGIESNRPGTGVPLVVVLDDAHFSGTEALHLLSSLLMPATATVAPGTYFPTGVAIRQNSTLIVICRWPHTGKASGWAASALNDWLSQAESVGVPITTISLPNGLPKEDAMGVAKSVLPEVSESDRERVVGSSNQTVVNPLVLNMRLIEVASHLDDPFSAKTLGDIDVARLPTSPLDHVRNYYERLPPSEKRLVSRLAAYGSVAPWRLLVDASDRRTPEAVIPEAIAVGLVSVNRQHHRLLDLAGFSDDLSVAFFEQQSGLLLRGTSSPAVTLDRIRPWVEEMAIDSTLPVSGLSAIGRQLAYAERAHAEHPNLPSFGSFVLVRRDITRMFRQQSSEWGQQTLAGELLAMASTPRRVRESDWTRIHAQSHVRLLQQDHPQWLASRASALSKRTMACREIRGALVESLEVDGDMALWRLEHVAGIFKGFNFDELLTQVREHRPEFADSAEIILARRAGPHQTVMLLATKEHLSPIQVDALAKAYALTGDFEAAGHVLAKTVEEEEVAIRAAKYFHQAGLLGEALAVLAPFIGSLKPALAAADIESNLDLALSHLAPFLDQNLEARSQASRLLARAGRYQDAANLVRETPNPTKVMIDTLRSLEMRKPDVPREALLADAEQSWNSGDLAGATQTLEGHLADPAIAALWAEYAWVTSSPSDVMSALRPLLRDAPTLSILYTELANERPLLAAEHGWLRFHGTEDVDLLFGATCLNQRIAGAASVIPRTIPSSWISGIMEAAARSGTTWTSDLPLAMSLEKLGHIAWSSQIVLPWVMTEYGETLAVRQMVEYGRLDEAAIWLGSTAITSLSMAATRACWHLARGEWDEAGQAFRRVRSRTPTVIRLSEVLIDAKNESRAALEAATLLTQLRLPGASFGVLAASRKLYDDPDVERALNKARYKTPGPVKRALHRHRRRATIRATRDAFPPPSPIDSPS